MKLIMRLYNGNDDYWRIREFLREVFLLNACRELNWHVARWDYWIWFANPDIEKISLEENVFIWETETGQIAAVLNPEGHGHAFPQIHPDFRTSELDEEMITAAEEHLSTTDNDGRQKLNFWIDSKDKSFQGILTRRGFHRVESPEAQEFQHRRSLDESLPDAPLISGYTIRSQGLDSITMISMLHATTAIIQSGITTFKLRRSTVVTLILSLLPRMVRSHPSVRSGSMM